MSHEDSRIEDFNTAAGPLAQGTVVHTGTTGLRAAYTTVSAPGGFEMPAYVARPESGGTALPVVLVLPEAFGLHEHIADIARRFAHEGYLAVAPDLMARHGDPRAYGDVDTLVTDLLQKIPDRAVMDDIDAALDFAVAEGGDRERIGLSGFCWGGRWVWLYAARSQVAAGVAWYGILDGAASGAYPDRELFPLHPIDVAGGLSTPVLGLHGALDDAIPLETVERMAVALAQRPAGAVDARVSVFDDAGHAFFADYRETFDAAAAPIAWNQALAWLREHGV